MKITFALAAALLVTCAPPVLASGFDCVAPEFPQRSSSTESARRIQKQVQSWRSCYSGYEVSGTANADAQKLNAQVETELEKWIAATRLASGRNPANAAVLSHIERERTYYLRMVQLR